MWLTDRYAHSRGPAARLIPVLFLAVCLVTPAAAHDVSSTDGLMMEIDDTGRVTGLEVEGREILTLGATGGFRITDYTGIAGTNLVANGGFEGGYVNQSENIQIPDGWSLLSTQGEPDDIMFLVDDSVAYEGSNSLMVVTTQVEPLDTLEFATNQFAVEAGVYYYCRMVVHSLQGFIPNSSWWQYDIEVYLDWYNGSAEFLESDEVFVVAQTVHNWTMFTGKAAAPVDAAGARVRILVTGNIPNFETEIETWIDDVQCFREPSGIRDLPVLGSLAENGGQFDLSAQNIGDRGLDLSASFTPLDNRIEVSGQVTPSTGSEGQDRALDLEFVLPVDTASQLWFWYDNPHHKYRIRFEKIFDEAIEADEASATLKLSAYNLSCIADDQTSISFGRAPETLRAFYIYYDSGRDEFVIRFQLGLAAERDHAEFDFMLYTSPPLWTFRGALAKYYEIHPDYGKLRTLNGQPLRGGVDDRVMGTAAQTDPEDFGVRVFHTSDTTDVQYLVDDLNLLPLQYALPWKMPFETPNGVPPPVYSEYSAATRGEPSVFSVVSPVELNPNDFMLNANDTTGTDTLLYRVGEYITQNLYKYDGTVCLSTSLPGDSFASRYLAYVEDTYTRFAKLGGDQYMSGIMMDLSNRGATTLDATRSRFADVGYDLVYSSNTFEPALWNMNSYQQFIAALDQQLATNHPDRDVISANLLEYGALFSMANHIDMFGFECSPITTWNWQAKNLDYRKIIAGSKPASPVLTFKGELLFDEPSNEYYKGMCDLWNIGLLYGFYLDLSKFATKAGRDLEELRDVSTGIIPYLDLFSELGWKPCTYIEELKENMDPKDDTYIQVERYGPDPSIDGGYTSYVVVLYNERAMRVFDTLFPRPGAVDATRDFRLLLHLDEIGLPEPVQIEEITVTLTDMEPPIDPDLTVVNNEDGTCLITGTLAWRDAYVLKVFYEADITPPAAPSGVVTTALPPS